MLHNLFAQSCRVLTSCVVTFQINTFYLQKEAELKLRLATLVSKQRSAATRMQPDLEEENAATKDLVEWRAVEEGFRLLQNDLLKLQVRADHADIYPLGL